MNLNSSDKGCALLTGSIVLENGRILDENKPRLLTFDGHIYIPGKIGGEPDELLVIVRFFAHQNNFSGSWPDVGNCFIHTVISAMPSDATKLATKGIPISDYDAICNAITLTPMGHNENFIPEPAQIMAFGIVNAVPKRSSTKVVFTTTPSQYVLGLKDYASSPRQAFPMHCKIDLTLPRYKKTDGNSWAPDVKLNGRTLFHGSITQIVRKLKFDTAQISYVKISVNDVVYSMGSNQATPIKIEPGTNFANKGKEPATTSPLKFSYRTKNTPMPLNTSAADGNSSLSTSGSSSLPSLLPSKRPIEENPPNPTESSTDTTGNKIKVPPKQ